MNRSCCFGVQGSARCHFGHSRIGPLLARGSKGMTKKLIPWNEFERVLSAGAPWLGRSWIAFTDQGVVLLSRDDVAEETAPNESEKD